MRRVLTTALAFSLVTTGPARASLPGAPACPVFPVDNVWHADVSVLPVHLKSALWLATSGAALVKLHPDFGWAGGTAAPYGLPYTVVDGTYPRVDVAFTYADESDPGPYPLGPDTPIEGGADALGDRHALVVDRDSCTLYETYDTHYDPAGSHAGSGAVFDLRSNALRPAGWTSADAAGLPILPGLLRLDEVRAGTVDHAIRMTLSKTDRSYVWPARHQAGVASNGLFPPMGAWFRLTASYDASHFSTDTQVVLAAMKRHGMILADNGSDWFFTGSAEYDWPDQLVAELKQVPASAFEGRRHDVTDGRPELGPGRFGLPQNFVILARLCTICVRNIAKITRCGLAKHAATSVSPSPTRLAGLELEGETTVEGPWVDGCIDIDGARCDIAMMRTPDGHSRIELSHFQRPVTPGVPEARPVNAYGYLRVMFAVDDLDDTLARLSSEADGARRHGLRFTCEVLFCSVSWIPCGQPPPRHPIRRPPGTWT